MKTSELTKVIGLKPIVIILGAIMATSALGGYKKHVKSVSGKKAGVVHYKKSAGLISDLTGRAFKVKNDATRSDAVEVFVGAGVIAGERFWVDKNVKMEVTTTNSNHYTVLGPALVEFVSNENARLFNGAMRIAAEKDKPLFFSTDYLNGKVEGEESDALLWVSEGKAQLLNVYGGVWSWHPSLEKDKVVVEPGYFTESSPQFSHLQPSVPRYVNKKDAEKFFAKFTVDEDVPEWSEIQEVKKPVERKIASVEEVPATVEKFEPKQEKKKNVLKEYLMLRQWGQASADLVEDEIKLQKQVEEKERKELSKRVPSSVALRIKHKIELKRKGEGLSDEEEKFVKSLDQKK